jgi:hypothetical protein
LFAAEWLMKMRDIESGVPRIPFCFSPPQHQPCYSRRSGRVYA